MTRLFVLGLLNYKPMSGYDIQQALQESDTERWAGIAVGSIYHALKKLEQEKFIEIDSIEQTGLRQKAIYKITESGKIHFRELLHQSFKHFSVNYPSSLYAALTFMNELPKKQIIILLESQKTNLASEYAALQKGLEEKRQVIGEIPTVTALVFENMFNMIREQQNFINKIIRELS